VQDVLAKAIGQEQSAYERGRLYAWGLLLTQRLAEAGKRPQAGSFCMTVLDDPTGTTPTNVRSSAARLLAQIEGQRSLETLLPLIEKGDIQFRVAALDAVSKIPGENVTSALVARLASVWQADLRAEMLDALAKRRDVAARPAVLAAIKDADAAVRAAAIHSLVALDAQEAIPPLVEMIVSRNDETAKLAADSLGRIPGDPPLAAAADAINTAPAKAKVALIELLAARVASAHRNVVLKQAADADASVRLAALRTMEKIGSDQDAARLVEIAVAATDGGEQSAALRAAAACAARGSDAEHRADAFIAALAGAKGGKRAAIERAMAKVGGAKALELVLADLKSEDVKTREGALDALADWQDGAALPPLLEVARTGTTDAQQVTAIRGVIQVIKNAPGTPAATKAHAYSEAFAAAKRLEEKKMILGAVGNEKGQEFFDLAALALEDETLSREAALAVIKTALPPAKGQPGLKGATVIETLKKAIPACPDPNLKSDAERYLKTIR
jgi:HEAT repeat protein